MITRPGILAQGIRDDDGLFELRSVTESFACGVSFLTVEVSHIDEEVVMRHLKQFLIMALAILFSGGSAYAELPGFQLDVVVDGRSRPEYESGGTIYIEAIRGSDYSLRLTNPAPYRVAVALSVDGLNTIDARHTDPWTAAKWVLDPYETAVISGWQVDFGSARRFYFTTEERSYGAAMGEVENLGVIEAVVYREREARIRPYARPEQKRRGAAPEAAPMEGAAERESKAERSPRAQEMAAESADDYAATGMGDRTRHEVRQVHLSLESHPVTKVRIRYEFRPQLLELGILRRSPLDRRERARGFEFCPE